MPAERRCAKCGRRVDLAWKYLPLVGYQQASDGAVLELRNCDCGSTLGHERDVAAVLTDHLRWLAGVVPRPPIFLPDTLQGDPHGRQEEDREEDHP